MPLHHFQNESPTFFAQEDEQLTALVQQYGAKEWSAIAEKLPGRVGKQCRERYEESWEMEKPSIVLDLPLPSSSIISTQMA